MTDTFNRIVRRVPNWSVYVVGTIPFVVLVAQLLTGTLGVDPVKRLEHELGEIGLQFLIATLAVTPLRRFTGIAILKQRRALGLLSFFYILAHFLTWLALDIQFLWGQIGADILKRPYITIGMLAFVLMIPLALTSNNRSIRKLGGAAWRRLHRLTYVVAILGCVHFVMVVKGWQMEPFVYLTVALALLLARLSPKRRTART